MELLLFIAVIAIIIFLCVRSEDKPRIDKDGRFIIRKSEDPETYARVSLMKAEFEREKEARLKNPYFPFKILADNDIPELMKNDFPFIKKIGRGDFFAKDDILHVLDIGGFEYSINTDKNCFRHGFYDAISPDGLKMITKIYERVLTETVEKLKKQKKELKTIKNKYKWDEEKTHG